MITANEAHEARLTDLIEGAMTADEAARLEAALTGDLRAELEAAQSARALLSELNTQAPPRDFVRKVQRRLRRRSGGRFFHPVAQPVGYKLSVEIFAVIAVVIMAACWLFLEAERRALHPGQLSEIPPAHPTAPKVP